MVGVKSRAALWMTLAILWGAVVSLAAPSGEEKSDRVLEKKVFVHFREHPAKPQGGGGGKPTQDASYAFLAKGCRWKTTEPFCLNAANGENLPQESIYNAVSAGMSAWETSGGSRNIFGDLVYGLRTFNDDATDGVNAISFGALPENTIAITVVWGYFGGPVALREIVEADILFNDLYVWGDAAVNPALMDVQNIATHELGHVAGMADLYTGAASQETMYGYSSEGDTIKRDLYNGDILGIRTLYGR